MMNEKQLKEKLDVLGEIIAIRENLISEKQTLLDSVIPAEIKLKKNLRVRPDWCPLVIDECCEWKYLGVHMWQTCEQHARHMYPDKRYVYCPSCGKRIKYVEVE